MYYEVLIQSPGSTGSQEPQCYIIKSGYQLHVYTESYELWSREGCNVWSCTFLVVVLYTWSADEPQN